MINNPSSATASTSNITSAVNNTPIVIWGDSLTQGNASYRYNLPIHLSQATNRFVFNGGVSGDTSTQIKTRMLAATSRHRMPTIIWAGRNNYSSPTTVKSDFAAMVAALEAVGNTNYLILSIINSSGDPSGSSNYNTIIQLNADLAAIYGTRYLDVRSYLVTQGTGTGQDATDAANDVIPASLRTDTLHLTPAAHLLIANYIVAQKSSIITPTSIGTVPTVDQLAATVGGLSQDANIKVGGSYAVGGTPAVYVPDQTLFPFSFVLGDGGRKFTGTSQNNTYVGLGCGVDTGAAGGNTAVGALAMAQHVSGNSNSAFGFYALTNNLTGIVNSTFGAFSTWSNTTGGYNAALGYQANRYNATGSDNTVVGSEAGLGVNGSTNVTGNTLLGRKAGYALITGADYNIAIGFQAADNITTGAKNIVIGYDIDAPSATSSNQLTIGNLLFGTTLDGTGTTVSTGKLGVGTATPRTRFDILAAAAAQLRLTQADNSVYTDFQTDSSGVLAITPSGAKVNVTNASLFVTGYSITGSSAVGLMDLSGTWNTSGQPTGFKINITDTASAASSMLMEAQKNGVSQFQVRKDGMVYASTIFRTASSGVLNFSGRSTLRSDSDGNLTMVANSGSGFSMLLFGGTTASEAGLKRSGADLQARTASDSAFSKFYASQFVSSQTTPTASTDAGTTGAIWADANYVYVQTGASTIRRVALTSF